MKKIILSIITVIILTSVFTACNTQENTQETINQQTDIQSSETIANETQSQTEQPQVKTYIGKWKVSDISNGSDLDGTLCINNDNTFTLDTNELPDYSTIISVSGIYIEENSNKIILTAKEQTHYDFVTKETTIEKTDSSETLSATVVDSNTLILDSGDETTEITRIN